MADCIRTCRIRRCVPFAALVLVIMVSGVVAPFGCVADAGVRNDTLGVELMSGDEGAPTACRVVVREPAVGHVVRAACRRAGSGLEQLLGQPVPAGVILEQNAFAQRDAPAVDQRSGEGWVMAIVADDAIDEPLELGGGARLSSEGYLAHEIAHRMAAALLFPAGTPEGPGYGTSLPDWLDEALALLVEPAADQRARLELLFDAEIIYALPLRRFLYMPHPALGGASPGSRVRRNFYAQSLAFGLFLREQSGEDGLRALVDSLRAGSTQGEALTRLRGLPADGGALEQQWLAWLRARRDSLRAAA